MPILKVRALKQEDPDKITKALKKTCLEIAKVYECKPDQVWATWEEIKAGFYVEGDIEKEVQPKQTHPPIAELLCFEGLSPFKIEELLKIASTTLSSELELSGNIFMTYHEAKSGRVIAGNGIVRKN